MLQRQMEHPSVRRLQSAKSLSGSEKSVSFKEVGIWARMGREDDDSELWKVSRGWVNRLHKLWCYYSQDYPALNGYPFTKPRSPLTRIGERRIQRVKGRNATAMELRARRWESYHITHDVYIVRWKHVYRVSSHNLSWLTTVCKQYNQATCRFRDLHREKDIYWRR